MRWLDRLFSGRGRRDEDDPLVKVVDMLSDPEARMWQERLRDEGIVSLVKSPGGLLGDMAYTSLDFSLWTKASDSERARSIIVGEVESGDDRPRREQSPG